MNTSTRFYNGTRDGSPYQARITETSAWIFEIEVVIFDSANGEPHYSFTRNVEDKHKGARGKRYMLRAVIANPDAF